VGTTDEARRMFSSPSLSFRFTTRCTNLLVTFVGFVITKMMISGKITMRAAKMYMVTDDTKRSTKTNQDYHHTAYSTE
jgi:hypothetical protein